MYIFCALSLYKIERTAHYKYLYIYIHPINPENTVLLKAYSPAKRSHLRETTQVVVCWLSAAAIKEGLLSPDMSH